MNKNITMCQEQTGLAKALHNVCILSIHHLGLEEGGDIKVTGVCQKSLTSLNDSCALARGRGAI